MIAWQRPSLPGPCGPSTLGAGGLNRRVRDGYGCVPSPIATRPDRRQFHYASLRVVPCLPFFNLPRNTEYFLFVRRISPRPIRIRPLHLSLGFHAGPINLVFYKGSYLLRAGHVISRGASRLDAFSAYPFPT